MADNPLKYSQLSSTGSKLPTFEVEVENLHSSPFLTSVACRACRSLSSGEAAGGWMSVRFRNGRRCLPSASSTLLLAGVSVKACR